MNRSLAAIVALICTIGMWSLPAKTYDPTKPAPTVTTTDSSDTAAPGQAPMTRLDRFTTAQNLLGVLFLAVLAFNLLVMALDFPRFELVGVIFLAVQAGGNAAEDAYKALAMVGIWILIGVVWVALNPKMRGTKMFDPGVPKREDEAAAIGV